MCRGTCRATVLETGILVTEQVGGTFERKLSEPEPELDGLAEECLPCSLTRDQGLLLYPLLDLELSRSSAARRRWGIFELDVLISGRVISEAWGALNVCALSIAGRRMQGWWA